MRDPNYAENFLNAAALDRCYQDGGKRQYDRNSVEGLRKSVSHCHDVNVKLIGANDELVKKILGLQDQLTWEKVWRWGIVAGVLTAVIAAFVTHFMYL